MKKHLVWISILIISSGLIVGRATGFLTLDWLEVAGFSTGLISEWLAVKNQHWSWPIGNINSAIYLILFFNTRLYANAGLQFLFIVIGFYGWYCWLRGGKNATRLPITHLPLQVAFFLILLTPLSTLGIFISAANSNVVISFVDTLTTVLSLVATYVLGRRHIENWLIWIVVYALYIILFASRGLYLTSILNVIFLWMCIQGNVEWKRLFNKQPAIEIMGLKT